MAISGGIAAAVGKTKNNSRKGRSKKASPSNNKLDHYLRILNEENLQSLEISNGKFHVKLSRQNETPLAIHPMAHPSFAKPSAAAPVKETAPKNAIKSPIAGIFYRAPSPSLPPFVSEGDMVSPGKVLCIVEAMKVMNEITADQSGRISKILVENGKPIEAGQELFTLEAG